MQKPSDGGPHRVKQREKLTHVAAGPMVLQHASKVHEAALFFLKNVKKAISGNDTKDLSEQQHERVNSRADGRWSPTSV